MRMFERKSSEKTTSPPKRQSAKTTKKTTKNSLHKLEDISEIQGDPVETGTNRSEENDEHYVLFGELRRQTSVHFDLLTSS